MKTIITIQVDDENGEPMPTWRCDDPETPKQFFDYITGNYDLDQLPVIKLEAMTPEEWAECERVGLEMA